MTRPRMSLLICTYERPDALRAVLRSVERQTVRADEVIVGDDGSGPETKRAVEDAARRGIPVTHAWLPHDGFRAGRMRNHAAARADGRYLVFIDDDILLHPRFIEDHLAAARTGYFVQGARALLGEEPTRRALAAENYWPGLLTPGAGNRKNTVRSPFLSRLFSRDDVGLKGIRTCNFAVWREDFYRVNGFNEDFVGWGREDSEFVTRLFAAGVRRRNVRFLALGCHLHHPPRSRAALETNDRLLAATVASGAARCGRGLDLHLGKNGE